MAYGEKFSLLFSDVYKNPRKLSILQKNYSGTVYPLIGTADPVVVKWENNDDFYNPIIGSTCEINLFVTEAAGGVAWDELDENWNLTETPWIDTSGTSGTNYDDWYDADEREYKVQISTGDISGSPHWDATDDQWQTSGVDWDDPTGQGFEFYWEGFIVVDRYQEAFTTTPYPIKLIASDGLGLLDGYDAPNSNIVLDGSSPSQTFQSNFDEAFYYVYKILQNTGLDFDIFVANSIRGQGFTNSDDKTILNDIEFFEYGVLTNSNLNLNAKDLLIKILRSINSRIFQSQGRWYIMSNSNLLDNRIYESQEQATVSTPIVENIYITTTENVATTIELNGFDADGLSLTWAITDDVDNGSTSLVGNVVTYTPTTDYFGLDKFYFTASNGTNTSTAAFVQITINEAAVEQPSGTKTLVPPYNFMSGRNTDLGTFFYGETIQQALSRLRSYTIMRSFPSTELSYLEDEVGGGDAIDLSDTLAVSRKYKISFGSGQSDSSDPNTWRTLQVGSKVVFYDPDIYISSDNTLDPQPVSVTTKLPRTPDFDNGVYSFKNGYYARGLRQAFIVDFSLFNYEKALYEANTTGVTIPRIGLAADIPEDLKDVGVTQLNKSYIVVVRIEDDFVVERYQFAL